jgi:hypothetical protein
MSDVSDQIAQDALKTASTSNDGVSVTRRSLMEQIEADRYLRSLASAASPAENFRLMNSKIVAPGGH